MSQPAPQQLFDGSFFEAILRAPALKTIPPAPIEAPVEADAPLPEFESFDWDAYNREFYSRLPEHLKSTEHGRALSEIAGTQIWMAKHFSAPILAYLLASAPAKGLWTYLMREENREVLGVATRGFQRTPAIVRQPVVRSRLVQWFSKNPRDVYLILMLWGLSDPPPPVVALAQAEDDGAPLRDKLPHWLGKFGIEATIAGLAMAAKPRTMARLLHYLEDPTELARVVEAARNEVPEPSPEPEIEPVEETSPHAPDSDAAHFWKAQCEDAQRREAERSAALETLLDSHERLTIAFSKQKAEFETIQKREKSGAQLKEKQASAIHKRLQTELDELKKGAERQNRKLRALEREQETLDLENRRFKKQLRRAGTLLEEERRRASALEARIAPAAQPVEAISTPQAQPKAPGKTVVVQSPTPLDEIFEWRADGRIVRITARAVRRLIDQNDEEGVFAVVQALDSLQKTDRSLHGKILKRIGDAGAYYARVLGENMARVLVDASNVARYAPNKYGKGQLRHITGMREELRRLNCFPIVFIADASLRYFIDDAARFRDMVAHGEIQVVDKGVEADEILAREARRTGAYVVTNDAKFFHKVSPDFEPPRVTFRIYDGTVIVDEF